MPPTTPTPLPDLPTEGPKLYRCGTLTYTTRHLMVLFFWLLWGDFVYFMMESVVGPIMTLKFKSLGASNMQMGLLLGSIPMTLGAFLNPVISFKSDRFRSRWGRRIPFLAVTLPFVTLGLVLLAFGDRIGAWLHGRIGGGGIPLNTVIIYTYATLLVGFTFFNSFVNSVFWYLFNDVVPEPILARFMSWFRIISMGTLSLYSLYVFPHSEQHATEILCGVAGLYAIGFTLMCLNVKEGQYPPPPPYEGGKTGPLAATMTFGKECHALRHYWYLWICVFIGSIGGSIGMFNLILNQKLGLSMNQIGQIGFYTTIVIGVLIIGSGWLADRYHPIRVVLISSILNIGLLLPVNMIWIFYRPESNHAVYLICVAIAIGLAAPIAALNGVWDPPMLMRLFPRSRFGQFCSTHNLWRTMGGVLGGTVAGMFIDLMVKMVGEDRAYFFIPVWQICFTIPSFIGIFLLYRSWKSYGGDEFYVPPIDEPPPDLDKLRQQKLETSQTASRRWHAK